MDMKTDQFEQKIIEYQEFKKNIKVASSQMLKMMSSMEIEMITKDILNFLDKKYKVQVLPDSSTIYQILESIFSNSIIRSESELNEFLKEIDHDYQGKKREEVIEIISQEIKALTEKVKTIYDTELTSCYADFVRRCTEEITIETGRLNQTIEFEKNRIKLKMQLKRELSVVLQKFLDGAYKMIHTQILLKLQNQINLLKNSQ